MKKQKEELMRFEEEPIYNLVDKYHAMGELASALSILDTQFTESRNQVRRVLKQLNENW